MTTFYARQTPPSPSKQFAGAVMQRRPQRVTTTMSWQLHQKLQRRADEEGRSLSNLIAHLLEVENNG
ncbi:MULTISPECIES: ribbon-helix-helix domain-containing protein [unclassified Synechococcus]|jgi:hypothetical protein|uniref:ribbon-helix-helix domain-containing protein n=1 Tax=unclassified Synechococcus TaxID=2626047 RepID=UPI0037D9BA7C